MQNCVTLQSTVATSRYLHSDFTVSCDTTTYRYFRLASVLLMFAYVIGLPILYCILLVRNRSKLYLAPPGVQAYVVHGQCGGRLRWQRLLAARARSTALMLRAARQVGHADRPPS